MPRGGGAASSSSSSSSSGSSKLYWDDGLELLGRSFCRLPGCGQKAEGDVLSNPLPVLRAT